MSLSLQIMLYNSYSLWNNIPTTRAEENIGKQEALVVKKNRGGGGEREVRQTSKKWEQRLNIPKQILE